MPVMPDHWIRDMATKQGMIEPFTEKLQREGVISYGLSSYGYDARVSPEFKIFTNVDSAVVDPKDFSEKSFVDRDGPICIIPPQQLRPGPHRRIFPHSARRLGHLPGQIDLCPLRHHRQCDAPGAGMGRAM